MRYITALAIAGILIGAVSLGMNQAALALHKRFKQRMIEAQMEAQMEARIPADIDMNRDVFTDFGMEVSRDEFFQVMMLDLLYSLRFFLIPATIGGALLIAYLWPSSNKQNGDKAPATSSEIG